MTEKRTGGRALLALGALLLLPRAGTAQDYGPGQSVQAERVLEARVWLDRGAEPLFRRGETARLYYRASQNAYVTLFQIDTNGGVRLLFPRSPDEPHQVRAGFDYRLLFPRSPFWLVEDDPGVGYFFLVASPEPFDFSAFGYSHFDRGWDLSRVSREVYRDPHVAMDDFVAALIPAWQSVPYALDFVSYQVRDPIRPAARFEYPRFMCYDCHGFRPYAAWNPYEYACTDFRLIVFTDPYYYPATRYRGSRVVFARPPVPFEPRFGFKERAESETSRPLLIEPERRASAPLIEVTPGRRATSFAPRGDVPTSAPRPSTTTVPRAGTGVTGGDPRSTQSSGTEQRRPSSALRGGDQRPAAPTPAVPGGGARPSVPSGAERPSTGTQQERLRPVLQPRPSSPPPAATPPSARPSGGGAQPRSVPGTTRTTPPSTSNPPPATNNEPPPRRPQPSTERPSPSTARPVPSSGTATPRPSSGSSSPGAPTPVPAPARPPGF